MSKQIAEIDEIISIKTPSEVIHRLRNEYQNGNQSDNLRFQLACALSKSTKEDMIDAIDHFSYFIRKNINVRESLYNLAMTNYVLGEYEIARGYCEDLYRSEPDNKQFQQLHLAVTSKHKDKIIKDNEKDTAIGITLGVGIAALAVGIGIALARRTK